MLENYLESILVLFEYILEFFPIKISEQWHNFENREEKYSKNNRKIVSLRQHSKNKYHVPSSLPYLSLKHSTHQFGAISIPAVPSVPSTSQKWFLKPYYYVCHRICCWKEPSSCERSNPAIILSLFFKSQVLQDVKYHASHAKWLRQLGIRHAKQVCKI